MKNTYSNSLFPLPDNLNPSKTVCYTIQIPDDPAYINLFLGALYELTFWFNYDRNELRWGRQVALNFLHAIETLRKCSDSPSNCGGGGDVELMIRQNPDNCLQIQSSADGTHWCTFIDFTNCFPSSSQPGGGTPQPTPGGGTATYCVTVQANNAFLVPFAVNAGDLLSVTNASGATNDGNFTHGWRCPDGSLFVAGVCQPSYVFEGTDPLPLTRHQALIWNIDGSYYPAMEGAVLVPSGVVNGTATLQINDAPLADNYGSFDVCVDVTNNSQSTFSHPFNFLLSTGGFAAPTQVSGESGLWVFNSGWTSQEWTDGTGFYWNGVHIEQTIEARTLTSISLTYNLDKGSYENPTDWSVALSVYRSGAWEYVLTLDNVDDASGDGRVQIWTGLKTDVTIIRLQVYSATGTVITDLGSCAGVAAIIAGYGDDPFA